MDKQRAWGFDNLKFLLIFCVVLGHLLEGRPLSGLAADLYRIIYSFHMPAFLLLSGWFARFDRRKIVVHLLYPYLLFQLLYRLCDHCLVREEPLTTFSYQVTTPHWLLWYLFALAVYYLLLPLLDVSDRRRQSMVVALCFLLSILSSFDSTVGYYLSLGRLFTFLPFFVLGFYLGKGSVPLPRLGWRTALPLSVAAVAVTVFLCSSTTPFKVFYGALPYDKVNSHPAEKLLLLVIACVWLAFFLLVVEPRIDRPIPVITTLGRNTLPIYLLHGLLVGLLRASGFAAALTPLQCAIIAALIVALLGNPITARLFRWVFTGWWLEKLWDRLQKE